MNPPTAPSSICALCKRPATLVCTECEDTPAYESPATNTYYCRHTCQIVDQPKHQTECERRQMRQLLYRAGSILQEVFYGYREAVFDRNFIEVKTVHGKTHLYKGYENPTPALITVDNILIPFPTVKVADEQEKRAVLTYFACDDALCWMHDLVSYILGGIYSQIKELHYKPKNAKCLVIQDDGENEHSVLKLCLKDTLDEWYILDLAGAQKGIFEAVIPAPEYEKHMHRTIRSPRAELFGYTKREVLKCAKERSLYGVNIAMNQRTSMFLVTGAEEWEKEHSMKISALLRLKDGTFESKSASLVAGIQSWVVCCVEELREEAKNIRADKATFPFILTE